MIKKVVYLLLVSVFLINFSACSLMQKPIDKRTGFFDYLKQTESNIRNEEWDKARDNLENSEKAWKKVKPLFQIDIDHDYVNSLEENLIKLEGYIETKEKGESLATILLVKDTWENIGSL